MSINLVRYLDAIDGRLFGYLDEQENLSVETAQHVQRYAIALVEGLVTPEHVMEDWEDFFDLADAFVVAYGSEHLHQLDWNASLLDTTRDLAVAEFSDADREFCVHLVSELDGFVTTRRERS